jgi:inward rectifier potassium channel
MRLLGLWRYQWSNSVDPFKNTNFTDAEAKITLGMSIEENKLVNKFYTLDLELEKINSLSLSWTLVHPLRKTAVISIHQR